VNLNVEALADALGIGYYILVYGIGIIRYRDTDNESKR